MFKRGKLKYVIIGLLSIGLLVGSYFLFFKNNDTKKETDTKEEQATEEPVVVPEKKLNIIDEDSNSRPYAIMINNHQQARLHHAGLQDAYIVYEMIVEGGLTRMMAVFKDKDTAKIGSVRSSRHYFLDYALENDAIYVHFGWSTQAQSDISTLGINNINGLYDSAFWRDTSLNVAYEHTAFTSMEKVKALASNKGYRTTTSTDTLLNYSVDEVNLNTISGSIVANSVSVPYSGYVTTSYTYDATNKVYLRFVNGAAHTDSITGSQYTAKNIITYRVENSAIDSYGRQTLNNINSNGGDGYYITNGYAVPIKWYKDSRSSQTIYKYLDGNEINVNDGNTFIQIEPANQTLTIS